MNVDTDIQYHPRSYLALAEAAMANHKAGRERSARSRYYDVFLMNTPLSVRKPGTTDGAVSSLPPAELVWARPP